mmetsp:Transcript_34207/g.113216  ORF Transcript_34207/g.113216 Transcript_34207/m.113216 type:complete len:270 (+) Transcript_34207:168-977(+)
MAALISDGRVQPAPLRHRLGESREQLLVDRAAHARLRLGERLQVVHLELRKQDKRLMPPLDHLEPGGGIMLAALRLRQCLPRLAQMPAHGVQLRLQLAVPRRHRPRLLVLLRIVLPLDGVPLPLLGQLPVDRLADLLRVHHSVIHRVLPRHDTGGRRLRLRHPLTGLPDNHAREHRHHLVLLRVLDRLVAVSLGVLEARLQLVRPLHRARLALDCRVQPLAQQPVPLLLLPHPQLRPLRSPRRIHERLPRGAVHLELPPVPLGDAVLVL